MAPAEITVSVVSHRQNALVNQLVDDLRRHCHTPLKLILTQNVSDETPLAASEAEIIVNDLPKGFGANHNAAFRQCTTGAFCVANPDIRIEMDPFPPLLRNLVTREAGVAGPLVRSQSGQVEDSARRFPTMSSLARKLFVPPAGPDYPVNAGPIKVDWLAGMFMLFRADAYSAVNGFDERYFLYYEDVDICRRLRARGYLSIYDPAAVVIHDARRASRRNLRLMAIHSASIIRYLSAR